MNMDIAPATRWLLRGFVVICLSLLGGCSLENLVKTEMPPTSLDPALFESEEGALMLYRGAVLNFREGFAGPVSFLVFSGRFTDELATGKYGPSGGMLQGPSNEADWYDTRGIPHDFFSAQPMSERWYRKLNQARNHSTDAIHYLRNFAPNVPHDLIGHLYAIRGMSIIYLADIFCSGVPLSEYESPGGMIYKPGLTTQELYTAAIAQFDSALANVPDSARFRYLALLGKARALVNLGRLEEAAEVASAVPTDFVYSEQYSEEGARNPNFFDKLANPGSGGEIYFGTIGDREGGNGMPFVSANDPRVPLVQNPYRNPGYPLTDYMVPAWMVPEEAPWNGTSTKPMGAESVTVMKGIEARLIEAEAAAVAGESKFLDILNSLRTTCTDLASCPDPAPAGTGGVEGLPPLTDPGNDRDRLKLVFDESAFWLFLTGHRQGALRRMVRVHGFNSEEVYPTGFSVFGGQYSIFTNVPLPATEEVMNPQYTGCFDRAA